MDLSVVPFNKQSNNHYKADNESEDGDVVEPKLSKNGNKKERSLSGNNDVAAVRYRECMRNHAATIGGHANDGCGEFLLNSASAAAADGSSLTCAACGCHRNFHRRETAVPYHHHGHGHPPLLLYNSAAAAGPTTPRWEHHHHHHHQHQQRMAAAQQREAGSYERRSSETPEREDVATANNMAAGAVTSGGSSGKRFRTKFTQEQKDRMQAFADSIGWRIQRHDDAAINQFCADIGVKRNVLKVWMHNNKNAHRRGRDPDDPPPGMSSASQIPTSNTPPPPPPPPQAVVGV